MDTPCNRVGVQMCATLNPCSVTHEIEALLLTVINVCCELIDPEGKFEEESRAVRLN